MTRHLDLLQRSSTRGIPRGFSSVVEAAHRRIRRQRRQRVGAVFATFALLGVVGVVGLAADDEPTDLAVEAPADAVAWVPDEDGYVLESASPVRERFDPDEHPGLDNPAAEPGRLEVHQHLDPDGTVVAAVVVGVVDTGEPQSTLLDVFPLAEGPVEGENGTYPLGQSDCCTNGLVVVERDLGEHRIRVAGRNIDEDAVVATLESIELSPDGAVEHIALPDGVPANPTYEGPDTSRYGLSPQSSTSAAYEDAESGQRFSITTLRDTSILPARLLVWLYQDAAVVDGTDHRSVVGAEHGDTTVRWNVGASTSIILTSDDPVTEQMVADIQTDGTWVDASEWADMVAEHPGPNTSMSTTTTTTTTVPTTTSTTAP